MSRYYKYKSNYKKVYPRKRWASNIKSDTTVIPLPTNATSVFESIVLCQNSAQTSTPTPVVLKFGRLKFKGDIRFSATNVAQFTSVNVYVVFVPQGNTLNSTLISNHPEYVITWTNCSLDTGSSFSLSSILKRNLNSGDSIQVMFLVSSTQPPSQIIDFNFFYTAQFWTTSA